MPRRTIVSQHYCDATLGRVQLTVRANAQRLSARWQGQVLKVSCPEGVSVAEYERIMAAWTPRLMAMRPSTRYSAGQQFRFEDFEVEITLREGVRTYRLNKGRAEGTYAIVCPADADFASPQVEAVIATMMSRVALSRARLSLCAEALSEARRLGLSPASVTISRGKRILGHCDRKGNIALSHHLMFMPGELRRFVICHELAHLSEMNHSDRFHALLNSYVDGRERELAAAMRHFVWPLPR